MYDYYNYYTTTNYAAAASTGLGIGLLIFFIILGVIGLAVGIFYLIALAKLYKKAGKPGWAVIVPVYNVIVLLDIAGYKWYYIFIYCASAIPVIGGLVVLLFNISMNIKLAKSYGQSVGYGIGLLLLSIVFVPLMAFKKDIKYVGPAVNGDIDFNNLF